MTIAQGSYRTRAMRGLLLVVALSTVGCAASMYAMRRPNLPCERAMRVTHRTLIGMGYTITELSPPGEDGYGLIGGTRTNADGSVSSGKVSLQCNGNGVTLQPIEGDLFSKFDFSRGFDLSFQEAVQRPDLETPAKAIGLQLLVEHISRFQAELDLGGAPTTGDAVLMRITVRNHTDRPVTVDPAGIKLMPAEGDAVAPLADAALGRVLASGSAADRVRGNLLTRSTVAANTSVTRFSVYPAGVYREAQISIEDTETGETEGFVARVE